MKWTKEQDKHLREFYNPRIHVSPAILAYKLKLRGGVSATRTVINRLKELGLRKGVKERF